MGIGTGEPGRIIAGAGGKARPNHGPNHGHRPGPTGSPPGRRPDGGRGRNPVRRRHRRAERDAASSDAARLARSICWTVPTSPSSLRNTPAARISPSRALALSLMAKGLATEPSQMAPTSRPARAVGASSGAAVPGAAGRRRHRPRRASRCGRRRAWRGRRRRRRSPLEHFRPSSTLPLPFAVKDEIGAARPRRGGFRPGRQRRGRRRCVRRSVLAALPAKLRTRDRAAPPCPFPGFPGAAIVAAELGGELEVDVPPIGGFDHPRPATRVRS